MKRIALAIENFSRYGGGAESYAVSLAETLIRNGWEVHFFGEKWDGEPAAAIFHRIRVCRFLPRWAKLLSFAIKHRIMVADQHFDVVLGFGNTIFMNVYQSHGGVHWLSTYRKVYSAANPAVRFIKRLLIPLSIKHHVRHWIESAPFRMHGLPRIIAISDMIRNDYVSYYGVGPELIDLVYNGVDPARFTNQISTRERTDLRRDFGIESEEAVFLFVSYDLEKKGVIPLLNAVARLAVTGRSGFKLLVVGGVPSRRLLRLVNTLGVNSIVRFAGPRRDVHKIFAASDVMVLPTYYDACSLVVFEAMMCGLPVITSRYNGAAGIIREGQDGFVVAHPPQCKELALRMDALLDGNVRKRMSNAARQEAAKYTLAENHATLLKIFEEVAGAAR